MTWIKNKIYTHPSGTTAKESVWSGRDDKVIVEEETTVPHGWIQWEGTNVCMDIHCICGEHLHVDADFCYYIKMLCCGRIYCVGQNVMLYEIDYVPENVIEVKPDDNT